MFCVLLEIIDKTGCQNNYTKLIDDENTFCNNAQCPYESQIIIKIP